MRTLTRTLAFIACAALWAGSARAQNADEIIEKHLAALGGRAALAKLESRVATGTVAVSVQGAELSGPIQIWNKRPNKSRTYFTLDLSELGADNLVVDQRFDGTAGFVANTVQGDRELGGSQLQNMKNASFPTAFLTYKESGAKLEVTGKEKVGDREAFVVLYTPQAGTPSRQYFDAETWLVLRTITKVERQAGGEIEQTTDASDYREVDGVKVPFVVKIVNPIQVMTLTIQKIEHNTSIDDAMFVKPK